MADKKISDLSAAGALGGTELVELVQSGSNVRSTVNALAALSQPLDSDLTAIAALTTTSFGRGLLALADGAALLTAAGAQASDADLTAIAALTTTSFGRSVLEAANAAALRVLADSPSNAEAVLDSLVDAKGDVLVGTANDTIARKAVGTNGQLLSADSTTSDGLAYATRAEIALGPTGTVANTYPRNGNRIVNVATLTSGTLALHAAYIPAGVTITNIAYKSGATAAVAPTNWWFGLFDSSRNILRQTADQTSTAWGTQTVMSVALSSAFVTTYSGLHYFGIMMAAGTVVSLHGVDASAVGTISAAPILCGNSSTGLTTPASCPNPAGAITTQSAYPYAWAT
jgi:hypothetical protein